MRRTPAESSLALRVKPVRAAKKTLTARPRRTSRGDAAIGSAAVEKATGQGWAEWFGTLDRAGAAKLDHGGIVAVVNKHPRVSPWWGQMITVQYERERGLREVHQTARGFVANCSRVVSVPITSLYSAWADARSRVAWLGKPKMTIRSSRPNKSIRITWDAATDVEVRFYEKSPAKSMVTVQHNTLANAAEVKRMKVFWGEHLDALRDRLEA